MESHPVYKVIFCQCHLRSVQLWALMSWQPFCVYWTHVVAFCYTSLSWLLCVGCSTDLVMLIVLLELCLCTRNLTRSQISFRFYQQHGSSVVWSECDSARMTTGNQLSLWSSGGQMWKLHTPLSQVIISNDIMHTSWVLDTKHMQKPQRKTLFNGGHSSPSPQARGAVTKCNHIR